MNKLTKFTRDLLDMLSLKLVAPAALRNVAPLAGSQINTSVAINNKHPNVTNPQTLAPITKIAAKPFSSSSSLNRLASKPVESVSSDTNLKPSVSTIAGGYRSIGVSIKQLNNAELPVRPKKPSSPYTTFLMEHKDEISRQSGRSLNMVELGKKLSDQWKSIDKTRYKNDYERQLEEYRQELEKYQKSLTDEQKNVLREKKNLIRERRDIKKLTMTKPPKLPGTIANFYTKFRCTQPDMLDIVKNGRVHEAHTIISKEYRNLSPAEKEKFLRMHEEDKIRFKREFNAWYDSVVNDQQLPPTSKKVAEELRSKYQSRNMI